MAARAARRSHDKRGGLVVRSGRLRLHQHWRWSTGSSNCLATRQTPSPYAGGLILVSLNSAISNQMRPDFAMDRHTANRDEGVVLTISRVAGSNCKFK